MAKQTINLGTVPTGAGGDTPRSAFTKVQSNFDELYVKAAEAYGRANAVGAVSQSGGVPTGAIIERGSNAAGEFTKYADGTVIMSGRLSPAGLTWTAGVGVRYALSPNVSIPTPIVSGRIAFHTSNTDVSALSAYVASAALGTSAITGIYYAAPSGTTGSAAPTTDYIIHGRWF